MHYQFLLTLGAILLLGLLTDVLGKRTFLPRVTLLLIFGVLIGKWGLDIIPTLFTDHFELIAEIALLIVGFLLGGKLTGRALKHTAKPILWISVSAALVTVFVVILGLTLLGIPLELSILLGCIAAATAPAATVDVILESGYQGPFADLLMSIVAVDDVWALVLFSIGVAIVKVLGGNEEGAYTLLTAFQEIGGAVIVGLIIGIPAAFLTGRIKAGQPMLIEAFGVVFLCGGIALWLDVSFLIAAIVLGATVANLAKHHQRPFNAIEGLEWPFMIIFFLLAGATLEVTALKEIGLIGIVYILCRVIGKILGAWMGSAYSKADDATRKWMGICLLPQAGVAIGIALVASNQFPEYRQTLLSLVISSTILFELVGPVFTRMALRKVHSSEQRI